MSRPGRLEGRTCLIVGGTGGIGLATARRFLEEGAHLVVAGQSKESGLAAQEELHSIGSVWQFTLDLADGEKETERLFEFALDVLGGRLDVLFHTAGVSGRKFGDGALHECSIGAWENVMRVNAFGAFLTNRRAVQCMLRQPLDSCGLRGTVVNVGSVLDRSPSPKHFGTLAYAASKGVLRALTLAAAARLCAGPHSVQFACTRIDRYANGRSSGARCSHAALRLCETAARRWTWKRDGCGRSRALSL